MRQVGCCWREIATLLKAIDLEVPVSDCCAEHRGEKVIHTLFALCNDLNSIQCVLKKTEYPLDLPAIGIQDNHLKPCSIGSICDQSVGCGSNRTFDQTEEDTRCIRVRRWHNPIAYVYPMPKNAIWQGYWQFFHGFDDNGSVGAHNHTCRCANAVTHEIKCHIPTVEDVRDTSLKHCADTAS